MQQSEFKNFLLLIFYFYYEMQTFLNLLWQPIMGGATVFLEPGIQARVSFDFNKINLIYDYFIS